MPDPKISVITVVYNNVDSIEKTIQSVLGQKYDHIEYIIIDGHSTDGTVDVIRKYESKISYWISEPDRGIYDAMNKAIRVASGGWLNFMNAGDCYADESVLEKIFAEKKIENYSFLYADFFVTKHARQLKVISSFEKGILLHQSIIYKKNLHDRWGEYLVTSKYIVSDYLFFNQIPYNEVKKVPIPISINSIAGVSGGEWCWYQKLCFDYIFNRISIQRLLISLTIRMVKNLILKLLNIFRK